MLRSSKEEDSTALKAIRSSELSVKSFYSALGVKGWSVFPLEDIVWGSWAPTIVGFFGWEVAWGGILTMDQLKRRGWLLMGYCYVCKNEEEFHGGKARELWHFLLFSFGILWVSLMSWNGNFAGKKRRKAWKSTPICLFWTVWKEHNWRTFEGCSALTSLKDSLISNLYMWFYGYLLVDDQAGLLSLIDFIEQLCSKY